jgi:glycosyltransferase involved in cell wall biosynthesis
MICNFYPPFFWGEKSSFSRGCVEFLQKNGHQTYILTGNYGMKGAVPDALKPGKPYRALRYVNYENAGPVDRYYVDRHNFALTKRVIREMIPDVVMLWDMQGISLSPVWAVQDAGVPHLFHLSTAWPDAYVRPGMGAGLKRLLKRILPNTIGGNLVLTPAVVTSEYLAQSLKGKYHMQQYHVIPQPVDVLPQVTPVDDDATIQLMYAGRLDEGKKIPLMLHALQFLREQGIDGFHLNLYGSVETAYLVSLQRTIRTLHLSGHVTVHGRAIPSSEQFQKNCIFLQPCVLDGCCLDNLLQAMGRGCAVIAVDTPITRELIEHDQRGLLFAADDPHAMMQQIKRLVLDAQLRSALGNAAHEYCLQRHSSSVVFSQIEELLLDEAAKGKQA